LAKRWTETVLLFVFARWFLGGAVTGAVVGGFASVFFAWVLDWPEFAGYLAWGIGALIGGLAALSLSRRYCVKPS
jgi:hypothetical protein